MKKSKMFETEEMNHFYDDKYFDNIATRQAWYVYCYKFLTCVNGEWLKSISPSNARNQVNLFRYVTVSDEAFVRWVLEVKRPKLLEEKKNGWPTSSGGRKPSGSHHSRQFSHRYAEIHYEVKHKRARDNSQDWNNLFWSMYRIIHTKLFLDPSSLLAMELGQSNYHKVVQPDEDDYQPNCETKETSVFAFKDEEREKQVEFFSGII